MKTRRIPLAIAVAAALLTPSTAAFAAALGEVAALSALGERFRAELPGTQPTLVVAGGVAANQAIGAGLRAGAGATGARLVVPPIPLCTDNGVMVAWAGAERLALGGSDRFDVAARARWPLDSADMALALEIAS